MKLNREHFLHFLHWEYSKCGAKEWQHYPFRDPYFVFCIDIIISLTSNLEPTLSNVVYTLCMVHLTFRKSCLIK